MKQHWLKKWLPSTPTRATTDLKTQERLYPIEFEMMLKGHMYERPTGKVRQCAVTVDGATRLVTSGDYVNKATYDALLRFNAIKPIQSREMKTAEVKE